MLDEHFSFSVLVWGSWFTISLCFHLTEVFASRNMSGVVAENPWNFLVHRWSDEVHTIAIKALLSLVFVWLLIFLVFSIVFFHAPTPSSSGVPGKPLSYWYHHLFIQLHSFFFIRHSSAVAPFPGLCTLSSRPICTIIFPQATATELTSRAFPHCTWAHMWNRDLLIPEQLSFSRDGYFYCTREKITSQDQFEIISL